MLYGISTGFGSPQVCKGYLFLENIFYHDAQKSLQCGNSAWDYVEFPIKGQLLVSSISPKNERKQVNLRYHSNKVEFFCSFFGRIEDTKNPVEIN